MNRPSTLLPDDILLGPDGDAEGTHMTEDAALWAFVHWVSLFGYDPVGVDGEAQAFLNWHDRNKDRTRWYA